MYPEKKIWPFSAKPWSIPEMFSISSFENICAEHISGQRYLEDLCNKEDLFNKIDTTLEEWVRAEESTKKSAWESKKVSQE